MPRENEPTLESLERLVRKHERKNRQKTKASQHEQLTEEQIVVMARIWHDQVQQTAPNTNARARAPKTARAAALGITAPVG